jgi:fermentation-respiration switch protein FrsA (DUF1100 family)
LRAAAGVAALALLASGCVGLEQKERELVFRPSREVAGWYSGVPAGVQDVFLPVGEGADRQRIHGWWWPDDNPKAPVVFYLHGARWNLTGHLNRIAQLRRFGFSVFAIDYRGFGRSDGDLPSEATVYEDARIGWRWLVAREPDASRRLIYGHSLGGPVAVDLAAQLPNDGAAARGLIIESSFTSLADIASEMSNGWLPVGLLTQKFDAVGKIAQIRMPVLVVHGAGDRYVPARFSEALYAAAPAPKKLLLVPNGSHNNSMWMGDADYQRALDELFGLGGALHGNTPANVPTSATQTGTKG